MDLEDIRGDGVIINLLLTLQCQFACDRCFYFSSPHMPSGYMSDEVLEGVRQQAETLSDQDIGVTINLIGGEPTLNWSEFERVFSTVAAWYGWGYIHQIEMTTNGWWLKSVRHTRKFFEVLAKHAPGFGIDEGFSVRISSSQYHDPFRPEWLQGEGRLQSRLDEVWNYGDPEFSVFIEEKPICSLCYEDWDTDTWDRCSDPDCEGDYEEYDIAWEWPYRSIPEPDPGYAWIYVEEQRDPYASVMSGKAAQFSIGSDRSEHCNRGPLLSYKPDGVLNDVCCRGSDLPVGTVYDDPIELILLAQRFFNEAKPNCYSCADDAQEWMSDNGIEPAGIQIREVAR